MHVGDNTAAKDNRGTGPVQGIADFIGSEVRSIVDMANFLVLLSRYDIAIQRTNARMGGIGCKLPISDI